MGREVGQKPLPVTVSPRRDAWSVQAGGGGGGGVSRVVADQRKIREELAIRHEQPRMVVEHRVQAPHEEGGLVAVAGVSFQQGRHTLRHRIAVLGGAKVGERIDGHERQQCDERVHRHDHANAFSRRSRDSLDVWRRGNSERQVQLDEIVRKETEAECAGHQRADDEPGEQPSLVRGPLLDTPEPPQPQRPRDGEKWPEPHRGESQCF